MNVSLWGKSINYSTWPQNIRLDSGEANTVLLACTSIPFYLERSDLAEIPTLATILWLVKEDIQYFLVKAMINNLLNSIERLYSPREVDFNIFGLGFYF